MKIVLLILFFILLVGGIISQSFHVLQQHREAEAHQLQSQMMSARDSLAQQLFECGGEKKADCLEQVIDSASLTALTEKYSLYSAYIVNLSREGEYQILSGSERPFGFDNHFPILKETLRLHSQERDGYFISFEHHDEYYSAYFFDLKLLPTPSKAVFEIKSHWSSYTAWDKIQIILEHDIYPLVAVFPATLLLVLMLLQSRRKYLVRHLDSSSDLEDCRKKYASIASSTSEGIWLLNPKLQTTETNMTLEEMLGYQSGEMKGRLPFHFITDEDRAKLKDILSQKDSDEVLCKLRWNKRGHFGIVDSLTLIKHLYDGEEHHHTLLILQDKSEENRIKKQLKILNESLERKVAEKTRYSRMILDSQADIVFVVSGDVIVDYNRMFLEFFGTLLDIKQRSKFPLKNITSLFAKVEEDDYVYDFEHTDLLAYLLVNKKKTNKVKIDQGVKSTIFSIVASYIEESLASRDHRDRIIVTMSNITQIESLKKDEINLVKLTSVGKLAAGITHEINTPLTYLKGNLELMELDVDDLEDEKVRQEMQEGMQGLKDGVSRLESTIKTMREIVGKGNEKKEPVNIYETIVIASRMLYSRAKHISDITINGRLMVMEMDEYNEEYWVFGYRQRLEQVWIIILNNALDELVKSEFSMEERYIHVDVSTRGDEIVVKFKDNAGGIPNEIVDQVFDPFISTKTSSGMGLGLNIAHKIILDHQGQIAAYNEGRCAVFETRLKVYHLNQNS